MSPPVDLARWALARELLDDVRPRVAGASYLPAREVPEPELPPEPVRTDEATSGGSYMGHFPAGGVLASDMAHAHMNPPEIATTTGDDAPDSTPIVTLRTVAEIAAGDDKTMRAVHEIRQIGEEVIAAEAWESSTGAEVKRYAVRLPMSTLVHLALNTTAAERAEIDARADWRGVDDAPDSEDPRDLPPDSDPLAQQQYAAGQRQKTVAAERLCVAALVTNAAGEVLLVRTRRGWELPGGGVEPGEEPIKAVAREVALRLARQAGKIGSKAAARALCELARRARRGSYGAPETRVSGAAERDVFE